MSNENSEMSEVASQVTDQAAGAVVVANNLISFAPGLKRADKLNVMEACRYLSLRFGRVPRTNNEFNFFAKDFSFFGGNEDSLASVCIDSPAGRKAYGATLETLSELRGGTRGKVNETLNALRRNKRALGLFESQSQTAETVNFQMLSCHAIDEGRVCVGLFFSRFEYTQKNRNFLFFETDDSKISKYEKTIIFPFDCSHYANGYQKEARGYLQELSARAIDTLILY